MVGVNRQKKVAFVSSFIPRKCGIANFTSDLIKNMGLAGRREFEPLVVAIQSGADLEYYKPVKLNIRKDVKYDYTAAADYINFSNVDVVSVQHEFGLFGGDAGSYLRFFLERLNKPVITTLHTVLDEPPAKYFSSLIDVCEASEKLIVMNKRAIRMLQETYRVPTRKIELIPHGIPDVPFTDNNHYKRKLGMMGRRIILTFGLLSRNKGIEVVLGALPSIVKIDPSVLYIVLGAMHPEVLRREGQSYKYELENKIKDLGLQKNVVFYNRFATEDELLQFLCAADIYVTPYLNKQQVTSGTLAFAVGAGKAVVSTPYWAAEELLAQGRGKLVNFGDSQHMALSIEKILSNNSLFLRMRRRAYEYGRSMTWPKVARAYWELITAPTSTVHIPVGLRTGPRSWKTPDYGRQQVFQSA